MESSINYTGAAIVCPGGSHCFHFVLFPPVLTTLVSLGSCQVWQSLLDPRVPETTAISCSETMHTWIAVGFFLGCGSRGVCNHMPWAWIMAHIPNK